MSSDVFEVNAEVKRRLAAKLRGEPEIIRFADNPVLASLCSCLGLQFEIGRKDYDRLSVYLGVDLEDISNPWESEIVTGDGEFGLRLRLKSAQNLTTLHSDLGAILHKDSLDDKDELSQIVIFPAQVAARYAGRGFDLVIVRDWLLGSALNMDAGERVQYLIANPWEIENNIAKTQVELMTKRQLAFFGTHDIVDHLLGADLQRFEVLADLFDQVESSYGDMFAKYPNPTPLLVVSYFMGVLLDDLAQTRWYGSENHRWLVEKTLAELRRLASEEQTYEKILGLPKSFDRLVERLRDGADQLELGKLFGRLINDVRLKNYPHEPQKIRAH